MSVRLIDVNIIIGLLDSAHVHHDSAVKWFREVAALDGWATCPITENGFIRIVSHPSYPNLRLTPALAGESLTRFKTAFSNVHQFWPDSISLTNPELFELKVLTGTRQLTDTYLAGLAFSKGGRLATFDGSIPWRAVRGAAANLVDRIIS